MISIETEVFGLKEIREPKDKERKRERERERERERALLGTHANKGECNSVQKMRRKFERLIFNFPFTREI